MNPVDAFQGRPAGIQPGRGGFMRNALDVPYVTDPTGATVKSGARKGEPKRIPYSSTSGFGTLIENRGSLEKWSERKVIEGLAADPALVAELENIARLDDDDLRKAQTDRIIARAKDTADASLAADRGTHIHLLTELVDGSRDITADVIATGIGLGLTEAVQRNVMMEWAAMLAANGLQVVEVEAAVVDDLFRCAGTLDRVVQLTRDLHFVNKDGEVIVVAAGSHVVLDIKSGSTRRTHAIQIASYAQSVPYDTDTETRGEWGFDIDQDHGLIAHIQVGDDDMSIGLIHVDLVAGRTHGGECVVMAKRWEQRTDVFSVAQIESSPVASPAAIGVAPADPPVSAGAPSEGPGSAHPAPAPRTPSRTPADERAAVAARPAPDEGDPVDDYAVLKARYDDLDTGSREWIKQLVTEAQQAGVSFHLSETKTVRRFELLRGLTLLCGDGSGNDDSLRACLEQVIGDVAQFPTVPAGHLLGSLSAREAATFSALCDEFAHGRYHLAFTDEGNPQLRPAA